MSRKNNGSSLLVAGLVVLFVLCGIIYLLARNDEQQRCKQAAVAAAVDTYPILEYPDIHERASLQEEYKNLYITENCQ